MSIEKISINKIISKLRPERIPDLYAKISEETEKFEIKPEDRNEKGELLVSPEGPVSNLGKQSELWWKIARTESFKNFFGDWQKNPELASKITDKNGEPLVIFRSASKKQLEKFYNTKGNSGWSPHNYKPGIYFSAIYRVAEHYRGDHGSNFGGIICAFANAKKPKYEPKIGTMSSARQNIRSIVSFLVPKFLLKEIINSISENDSYYYNVSGENIEDAVQLVVNNPDQILIIPSPVDRTRIKNKEKTS